MLKCPKCPCLKHFEKYGFFITKEKVIEILKNPENITTAKRCRKIAQSGVNDNHVLRIVFEEKEDVMEVIIFYPARRGRYED
ncbi:MAG: DUF4258 domain-containing protein [Nitrospirota bacterium]